MINKPEEFFIRLKKVEELRELGIEPYAYKFHKNFSAKYLKENFEKLQNEEIKFAGRIMSVRIMGKALFATLRDETEDIQIYIKTGETENPFNIDNVAKAFDKYIDIGDIIGVEGKLFKTHTGEITIFVKKFQILSKCLLPLPDKWHGLKDIELQYRERYLHLIVDREAIETFKKKSKIIKLTREFFENNGFIEIDTPILQPIYGGANATPFETYSNALDTKLYLRIANELYLKRLIVGGYERVYEIIKNFRNEGIDKSHYPEFLALEAYLAYADYYDMMEISENYLNFIVKNVFNSEEIEYQGNIISFKLPFKRISYIEELKNALGFNPIEADIEFLREKAKRYIENVEKMSKGKIIDKLFDELIGKNLIQPTIVMDHPIETSPLAKIHRKYKDRVERFEIYLAGFEIVNAFSELNDPIEQRKRFEEQIKLRAMYNDKELPEEIDEDFLNALEYGMPPTGGLGFGLDRICMILLNKTSIRDVIPFPQLKPK
ncbi:MAG: lysine--tRNA ligase [candidate division WOR-3 bacterium]|jgi:lysyl-tRNA synthetase class 2